MDFWQRARVFAEEAAKMSHEISKEAAKKSQELTQGAAKFSQKFVSETAKKSKELAVEASKKADLIKIEAMKRADQIKTLAGEIEIPIPIPIPPLSPIASQGAAAAPEVEDAAEMERFGVTEELREFVKGISIITFRDFPMQDEPEVSEVPTVSNVRQDLNQWQARHATFVLSAVKEISKFRYELCPRYMKERKFWQIYFLLVNNYVAPYEKQYMENLKVESVERTHNDGAKESSSAAAIPAAETKGANLQSKTSAPSNPEHDLDVFLLGDLGSDDDGPDDGDDGFDDDFDKIESNSGVESDDGSKSKQSK